MNFKFLSKTCSDKKQQLNDSLYRRHLRQVLEANEEKLTKFHEGKNVYLPLAPHTGNLINKLVPKWPCPTIPDLGPITEWSMNTEYFSGLGECTF